MHSTASEFLRLFPVRSVQKRTCQLTWGYLGVTVLDGGPQSTLRTLPVDQSFRFTCRPSWFLPASLTVWTQHPEHQAHLSYTRIRRDGGIPRNLHSNKHSPKRNCTTPLQSNTHTFGFAGCYLASLKYFRLWQTWDRESPPLFLNPRT